jgi:RimJ/RimL family protein N-acetyltransferase
MNDLKTDRLLLRRWRPEDGDAAHALMADPHVRRFFFRTRERADSDAWVNGVHAHWDRHGFGLWAVEVPGEAAFIGFVGLVHVGPEIPAHPAVEAVWTLGAPFWGRGYAPEAARAAIGDGFGRVGLKEIVAFTATPNAPSRKVMEKLGMVRDPADDFIHPNAPPGHEMSRHVVYRIKNTMLAESTMWEATDAVR